MGLCDFLLYLRLGYFILHLGNFLRMKKKYFADIFS